MFANFAKSLPSFAKFMKISLEFGQHLSELCQFPCFHFHITLFKQILKPEFAEFRQSRNTGPTCAER